MENNNEQGQGQEVILRKIPIAILIDALNEIWESGIDYVDIVGKNGVEQDTIGLRFREDYAMRVEQEDAAEDSFPLPPDDEEEIKTKNINLSDEDLDELI